MIDGNRCYDMLQKLQNHSARSVKELLLIEYADQKAYWKYSLDPMINYFITIDPAVMSLPIGKEVLSEKHMSLLASLSNGYRGNQASEDVNKALSSLGLKGRYVFLTILNKRPECGVSTKIIEKVFPGLLTNFRVQLAALYKGGNIFENGKEWCISPKIDGLRGLFINGKFYSRNGKEIQGLNTLASEISAISKDIVLDGELTVPGKTFNELSGEIRSFKESLDVRYNVFDMHTSSVARPLSSRLNELLEFEAGISQDSGMLVECLKVVPHCPVFSHESIDNHYLKYVSQGYEGAMLKDLNGLPYNGRNKDWLKLKPNNTADVVVIGTEEGEGKYEHAVGALIVDYNGKEVRVGSGLSDKQRFAWYERPSLIIGKTIEVMYMEETEYGSLRHPRFKTVRGDK